eukprot:13077486-Heterocapsa_arctica.AAC.1
MTLMFSPSWLPRPSPLLALAPCEEKGREGGLIGPMPGIALALSPGWSSNSPALALEQGEVESRSKGL